MEKMEPLSIDGGFLLILLQLCAMFVRAASWSRLP